MKNRKLNFVKAYFIIALLFIGSCSSKKYSFEYTDDKIVQDLSPKFTVTKVTFNLVESGDKILQKPKFMKTDFSKYPNANELSNIFSKILEKELLKEDLLAQSDSTSKNIYNIEINFSEYKRLSSLLKGNAFAFAIFSTKLSILKDGKEVAYKECNSCKLGGYLGDAISGSRALFMYGDQENEIQDFHTLAEILLGEIKHFGKE